MTSIFNAGKTIVEILGPDRIVGGHGTLIDLCFHRHRRLNSLLNLRSHLAAAGIIGLVVSFVFLKLNNDSIVFGFWMPSNKIVVVTLFPSRYNFGSAVKFNSRRYLNIFVTRLPVLVATEHILLAVIVIA